MTIRRTDLEDEHEDLGESTHRGGSPEAAATPVTQPLCMRSARRNVVGV